MIRKFRMTVTPSEATEAILHLHKAGKRDWPEAWASLHSEASQLATELIAEAKELRELLREVVGSFWIEVEEDYEHPSQRAVQLKFPCFTMFMDMKEVLEDEGAVDPVFALAVFLAKLRKSVAYDIKIKMGSKNVTADEALTELIEQARVFGIAFSTAEEDAEGVEEEEPPKKKRKRKKKKEEEPEEQIDPEDFEATFFAGDEGTGFFGGLDEEPPPPPPPDEEEGEFSFGEAEWDTDIELLPMDARFFLETTQLEWPCKKSELNRAYKKIVRICHPDRNLDDPRAHQRFIRLQRGYELLSRRL